MEKEKWTKDMRDLLADYEMAAPEDLWRDIESALPKPQARIRRLFPWAAAAAIALLVAGGGSILLWKSAPTALVKDRDMVQLSQDEASTPIRPLQETEIQTHANPVKAHESMKAPKYEGARISFAFEEVEESSNPEPLRLQDPEPPAQGHSATSEQPAVKNNPTPPIPTRRDNREAPAPAVPQERRLRGSSVTMGLLAENITTNNRTGSISQQPVALAAPAIVGDFSDGDGNKYFNTSLAAVNSKGQLMLNDYEETVEHHQPLQVGVSVRYALNDRWALESGVVYSHVTSDFTRKMPATELKDHQTLQYVGIPLNVMYRLWSHDGLSVYGSAGAEADVNVKATLETDGLKRDIGKDRVQWSANAAIDAQYQFFPHLSIYLQPGLQYYLDNGSAVKNIFKDQPLGFSMQFGVRVNLNE